MLDLTRDRGASPAERTNRLRSRRVAVPTAAIVLGIALAISVVGSVYTYSQARRAFDRHSAVDHARDVLGDVYRLQLDQETGLRGYLASGESVYLEPYAGARRSFTRALDDLSDAAARADMLDATATIADIRATHDIWDKEVAQPLISAPRSPDALQRLQHDKLLMDRMRGDFDTLDRVFVTSAARAYDTMQELLKRIAFATAALMLLLGLFAIIADVVRSRTQAELDRERVVADTLQRAFISGWDVLPTLRVGTAYVSSTQGATVGGDIFDVHRIDDHRSLVLVADVSGKGIQAAVETAFVKYAIRTLADELDDPGVMLTRFNRLFMKNAPDVGSFVSLLVGILDQRDRSVRYASAGLGSGYVRRADRVEQLAVTGPLVGLTLGEEFGAATVYLDRGDLLVVATDGLTEARDTSGVMLEDEGAMRWIAAASDDPQELADQLVDRVARFSGGRITDDLALLAISFAQPGAAERPRRSHVASDDAASGSAGSDRRTA